MGDLIKGMEPETPEGGGKISLAELRAAKEPHGELVACGYSFSENGMSMYSHAESSMTLELTASGEWQFTSGEQSDMEGGTVRVYRVDPELPEKIRAFSNREDLPSLSGLKETNDPRYQVTDYSSSSHISLVFDDREIGGQSRETRTINTKAARQHGKDDVISGFLDLLKSCEREDMLISEKKISPKTHGIFSDTEKPVSSGKDVCPCCGAKGVTGKFCFECGARMPGR